MVCTKSRKRKKSAVKGPLEKPSSTQTSPYQFLSDKNVVRHIQRSKTMFIMRGLPGSGKSTLVKQIQAKYKSAVVCSADDYFSDGNDYEFKLEELKVAHQVCKDRAQEACEKGESIVIIDNTNIRRWEMSPYFGIADRMSYQVILVEPMTPWRLDPTELAKRNSHGVTEEALQEKLLRFVDVFPLYYGWFLNVTESEKLTKFGRDILKKCFNVPEIGKTFRKDAGIQGTDNFALDDLFTRAHFKTAREMLHCTTLFSLGGKKPGTQEYAASESVKKSMGQVFLLSVIGFSFSPQAFSARLKLNSTQLKLWARDDDQRPESQPSSNGETPNRESNVEDRDTTAKNTKNASGNKIASASVNPETVGVGCDLGKDSSKVSARSWSSVVRGDSKTPGNPSKIGTKSPTPVSTGTCGFEKTESSGQDEHDRKTSGEKPCSVASKSSDGSSQRISEKLSNTMPCPVDAESKTEALSSGRSDAFGFESDEDEDWFGAFQLGDETSEDEISEGFKILGDDPKEGTQTITSESTAFSNPLYSNTYIDRDFTGPSSSTERAGIFTPALAGEFGQRNQDDSASKISESRECSRLKTKVDVSTKIDFFKTIGQHVDDETSKQKEIVSKIAELADKMVAVLEVCDNGNDTSGKVGTGTSKCRPADLPACNAAAISSNDDDVFEAVTDSKGVGDGTTEAKGVVAGKREAAVASKGVEGKGVRGTKGENPVQKDGRPRKTSRDKVDIGLSRQKRPSVELLVTELESLQATVAANTESAPEGTAEIRPVESTSRAADAAQQDEGAKEELACANPDSMAACLPVAIDRQEDEIVVKKKVIFQKESIVREVEDKSDVKSSGYDTMPEGVGSPKKKKKKKKKKEPKIEGGPEENVPGVESEVGRDGKEQERSSRTKNREGSLASKGTSDLVRSKSGENNLRRNEGCTSDVSETLLDSTRDAKVSGAKKGKKKKEGDAGAFDDEIAAILREIENEGANNKKSKHKRDNKGKERGGGTGKVAGKEGKVQRVKDSDAEGFERGVGTGGDEGKAEGGKTTGVPEDALKSKTQSNHEDKGHIESGISGVGHLTGDQDDSTALSLYQVDPDVADDQTCLGVGDDIGWQVVTKGHSVKPPPTVERTYLPNASVVPKNLKLKLDDRRRGNNTESHLRGESGSSESHRTRPQKLRPTPGFGNSAHITMGCAENVNPVEARYDVLKAVQLEAREGSAVSTFSIEGATVKYYGQGHFCVYLDECVKYETFFGGYY